MPSPSISPTIGMSGKWGSVHAGRAPKTIEMMASWQIASFIAANPKYVNSSTKGGTNRRMGNLDWLGSYLQHTTFPTLAVMGGYPIDGMPGAEIVFKGYVGPFSGQPGTNGPAAVAMAIVESVQIDWDWSTADVVKCLTNIAGAGQYGQTGSSPDGLLRVEDDTPYPDASEGLETITPVGEQIFIALPSESMVWGAICVSRATLSITSNNQTFVNSCTDGLVGRRMGNIDWTLSLVMSEANIANNNPFGDIASLTPGQVIGIRLPSYGSAYWELLWGRVRDYSNYVVNRDTGEIISYTVNIEMNAWSEDSALSIGHIRLPNSAEYWPGSVGSALLMGEPVSESDEPANLK